MSIHKRIRETRTALEISKQKLADAVGVSRAAIQQWEREDEGRTAPRPEKLEALAKALKVSVNYLRDGRDEWPFKTITPEQIQQFSPAQLETVENFILWALDKRPNAHEESPSYAQNEKAERAIAPEPKKLRVWDSEDNEGETADGDRSQSGGKKNERNDQGAGRAAPASAKRRGNGSDVRSSNRG